MKKILKRLAVSLVIMAVIGISAYIGISLNYESLFPKKETTAQTTEATTAAPSAAETTRETTESVTLPAVSESPVIDFSDFSIIDICPLSLASGSWDVAHCQGIAVDMKNEYIYYSYTHTFVKCDFKGNVVGTITGIKGHLGDMCFNEDDGRVYATLNPPGKKALYVAIIDVDKLDEIGLNAVKSGLIRTVHLKDAYADFSATVKVNNKEYQKRYGVTGLDGITFGPSFSSGKGNYLTVACGILSQPERPDNNYQVLLQYDVQTWWKIYSEPLSYKIYHKSGPACDGKYFVYTGNTHYGVQTMTYFDEMNLWLLNVYATKKSAFRKYTLFTIDGDIKPVEKELIGQPEPDVQKVLTLYCDGDYDSKNNIYGWYSKKGSLGIDYIGDCLFYIIHPFTTWYETETAVAYLYVWDSSQSSPFTLAAGIDDDYKITKKKAVS